MKSGTYMAFLTLLQKNDFKNKDLQVPLKVKPEVFAALSTAAPSL